MACNTAHMFMEQFELSIGHKITSMIDVTIEDITSRNLKKIGLLASPNTFKSGLYARPLRRTGVIIETVTNQELQKLEELIRRVIANQTDSSLKKDLEVIVDRMVRSGCEAIILGCTELSVINGLNPIKYTIDPLTLIAKQLV